MSHKTIEYLKNIKSDLDKPDGYQHGFADAIQVAIDRAKNDAVDNAELLRATQKLSNGKIVPSDEVLIEFLDWFGTWQTDKNLDDYGINDVLDSFKTSLIAKHSK